LSVDEVGSENGGLAKLGEPTRFESYASILERAQRDSVTAAEKASLPLEMMHWSDAFVRRGVLAKSGSMESPAKHASAASRLLRHRAHLNPKTARSQFRGGIIMGSGWLYGRNSI